MSTAGVSIKFNLLTDDDVVCAKVTDCGLWEHGSAWKLRIFRNDFQRKCVEMNERTRTMPKQIYWNVPTFTPTLSTAMRAIIVRTINFNCFQIWMLKQIKMKMRLYSALGIDACKSDPEKGSSQIEPDGIKMIENKREYNDNVFHFIWKCQRLRNNK